MARATTKEELLFSADENFSKLMNLIDSMSIDEQIKNFDFSNLSLTKEAHWHRDQNIKDVLMHLYEWHQLLLNWVNSNINGIDKAFLLEGYNWKTYGQMNIMFFEKHQNTQYTESLILLSESHQEVISLIEKFSTDELFLKKQFKWTASTTLGSYCVSATTSHYDWAIKKIKKHIKTLS